MKKKKPRKSDEGGRKGKEPRHFGINTKGNTADYDLFKVGEDRGSGDNADYSKFLPGGGASGGAAGDGSELRSLGQEEEEASADRSPACLDHGELGLLLAPRLVRVPRGAAAPALG